MIIIFVINHGVIDFSTWCTMINYGRWKFFLMKNRVYVIFYNFVSISLLWWWISLCGNDATEVFKFCKCVFISTFLSITIFKVLGTFRDDLEIFHVYSFWPRIHIDYVRVGGNSIIFLYHDTLKKISYSYFILYKCWSHRRRKRS